PATTRASTTIPKDTHLKLVLIIANTPFPCSCARGVTQEWRRESTPQAYRRDLDDAKGSRFPGDVKREPALLRPARGTPAQPARRPTRDRPARSPAAERSGSWWRAFPCRASPSS